MIGIGIPSAHIRTADPTLPDSFLFSVLFILPSLIHWAIYDRLCETVTTLVTAI